MCYAVPARVLGLSGNDARVDYGGVVKTVNVSLIEDLAVDDYVLVHAGFAIEKLSRKSAEESLALIAQMMWSGKV
ncbi:HypC/HybG/HupF family hydrogenase formation chaperone [Candidatus Altiarchaeota archaeon]